MKKTKNYKLNTPERKYHFDIEDFNENAETLDGILDTHAAQLSSIYGMKISGAVEDYSSLHEMNDTDELLAENLHETVSEFNWSLDNVTEEKTLYVSNKNEMDIDHGNLDVINTHAGNMYYCKSFPPADLLAPDELSKIGDADGPIAERNKIYASSNIALNNIATDDGVRNYITAIYGNITVRIKFKGTSIGLYNSKQFTFQRTDIESQYLQVRRVSDDHLMWDGWEEIDYGKLPNWGIVQESPVLPYDEYIAYIELRDMCALGGVKITSDYNKGIGFAYKFTGNQLAIYGSDLTQDEDVQKQNLNNHRIKIFRESDGPFSYESLQDILADDDEKSVRDDYIEFSKVKDEVGDWGFMYETPELEHDTYIAVIYIEAGGVFAGIQIRNPEIPIGSGVIPNDALYIVKNDYLHEDKSTVYKVVINNEGKRSWEYVCDLANLVAVTDDLQEQINHLPTSFDFTGKAQDTTAGAQVMMNTSGGTNNVKYKPITGGTNISITSSADTNGGSIVIDSNFPAPLPDTNTTADNLAPVLTRIAKNVSNSDIIYTRSIRGDTGNATDRTAVNVSTSAGHIDLSVPTPGNGQLILQKNNSAISAFSGGAFTANKGDDSTYNIPVGTGTLTLMQNGSKINSNSGTDFNADSSTGQTYNISAPTLNDFNILSSNVDKVSPDNISVTSINSSYNYIGYQYNSSKFSSSGCFLKVTVIANWATSTSGKIIYLSTNVGTTEYARISLYYISGGVFTSNLSSNTVLRVLLFYVGGGSYDNYNGYVLGY